MKPKMNDPHRAKEWFKRKLAFSCGPFDLHDWLDRGEDVRVVDVRAPSDFALGHVPGAVNVPKERWDEADALSDDSLNVVYGYAASCHLAARACREFAGMGYSVMEMDGGMQAWRDYGFDAEAESMDAPGPNLNLRASETGSVAH